MIRKADLIVFFLVNVWFWAVFLLIMNPAATLAGGIDVLKNISSSVQQYSPDSYENDNRHGYKSAQVIVIDDSEPQQHNFHKTGDVDWVKFYGLSSTAYRIEVLNPGSICDAVIELYDEDGTTLLREKDDYPAGQAESLDYIPSKEGIYYVKVNNYKPEDFGPGTEYDLKVWKPTAPSFIGILTGTVSDGTTKAAIRNAVVKTNHMGSSLTNARGSYTLIEEQGDYVLTVNAKGYLPFSQNIAITPGKKTVNVQMISVGSAKARDFLISLFSPAAWGEGENISLATGEESSLNGITYSANLFVAAGDYGTIDTSPDGISWTDRSFSTDNELYGIAYGNSTSVAVGDYGTVLSSGDGILWAKATSNTENHLYGVAHGNGLFVGVGERGKILSSTDGNTWIDRGFSTDSALYGITYGNGKFVVVGDRGKILSSTDGNTWTDRDFSTDSAFYGITYGNDTFVAVGEGGTILTSSDGTAWADRSVDPFYELYAIAYGNDTFMVAGDGGKLLSSRDAVTWKEKGLYTEAGLYGIAYGGGVFVAVGDHEIIQLADAPLPDLTGEWISLAPKCKTAKSGTVVCKITGTLNVQNIGNNDAGPFSVRFYLSDNEADIFLKEAPIPKIKTKTSKTLKLTYTLGVMITGKHIVAVIDEVNAVTESDKTNNLIISWPIQ
jgi:hypothetical protein